MSFVFAVLKRWSIANENAINIFYFFERVDNFVASYSCHPRTRKLNEGEIGILKVLSIKTGQTNPWCKLLSQFAGDEMLSYTGKLMT